MTDTLHFDHLGPAALSDAVEAYRALRRTSPVAWSDRHGGFAILSRYGDVRCAAQSWPVFSSMAVSIPGGPGGSIPLMVDPPDHSRYRSLLSALFSPARVRAAEPDVQRLVNELVDGFVDRGSCDVSAELTQVVPTLVLARMMGVTPADERRFLDWVNILVYQAHPDLTEGRGATLQMHAYLSDLACRRDVFGLSLSQPEVVNICMTLVFAALGPTTFLLNGALLELDRDRETRRRLIGHPELMTPATEELLRYLSPVRSIGRVVKQGARLFGHDFCPGERVLLLWGSANRDEVQFDAPETLLLDRAPNRHLAFGAGVHRCVGAHLARLEFRVVLQEILRRLPDYRVVDPSTLEWQPGHTSGITRLPIAWSLERRQLA